MFIISVFPIEMLVSISLWTNKAILLLLSLFIQEHSKGFELFLLLKHNVDVLFSPQLIVVHITVYINSALLHWTYLMSYNT